MPYKGTGTKAEQLHLARNVSDLRRKSGLTLAAAASAIGVSVSQLSHLECGNYWPSITTYARICALFRCGQPPLLAPSVLPKIPADQYKDSPSRAGRPRQVRAGGVR